MENNNEQEIDPKKVENLHKLLAVFDTERLTSKDFIGGFKQVIDHVKNTQDLTVSHLTTITKAVNDAIGQIAHGNQSQMSSLRDELTKSITDQKQNLDTSHADALSRLETAIAGIQNGKDADEDVIVDKVLAKIPPAPELPIGEDFRNGLEALSGDDRLDKSAIRGLDDIEKKVNSVTVVGNMGTGVADSTGHIGRYQYLKFPGSTITTLDDTATISIAGGAGTDTSVSVVSANGLAGTVANPTTTPAITLSTTVTGVLKGNGTAISAAVNSDLPAMSATVGGAVPTPPNNTTTFLRGDGTFATPAAGTGTVTSVSVATANGVSGSVATSTTTPAITLALGAITPSSVAASGTVTGSNLSGTNTGDQTLSDATISVTDITTNNVSITAHGFAPKAPNDTSKYLRGDGTWATPAAGASGITRTVAVISTNTAAGAAASTDYTYYVSGASTLTLPTAAGNTNMYRVMRTGTSTVGIATTSAQTINGAAAPLNLIVQYASVDIQSDGSNWFIH